MSMETKRVIIRGTIHFYCEGQLCDDSFFDPENDTAGVIPMTIMVPLRQFQFFEFDLSYTDQSSVGEILKELLGLFGLGEDICFNEHDIYFLSGSDRIRVWNFSRNFAYLKEKYFDPTHSEQISVVILISADAGCVDEYKALRFYVHSKESGSHHEPHIHVFNLSREYEASISIRNQEVLVGTMPKKLLKIAQKRIREKQEYFYYCWNTYTDGLEVDINHGLGLLKY